ncbi:MAG: type II secretion system F family protein [Marmoricola sp.]
MLSAVLPAVLAGLAMTLALPPRPGLVLGRPEARAPDDRATLARLRPLLTGLTVVGVSVFLGGPFGVVGGLVAGALAWRVLGRVESPGSARRRAQLEQDLPAAVDLLVAAFGSGAAPGPALGLVGDALGGAVGEELAALRHRLELGAEPGSVWRGLSAHPQLGPLGRALGRAHDTGSSVTTAGERLADELRERSHAEVEARARSVSTKAAVPLGACFLPAFVLLGIVPLIAGLVSSMHLFG